MLTFLLTFSNLFHESGSRDIVGTEIGSILNFLEYICSSDDLGNHNVGLGLIISSPTAQYLGSFQPSDPNNPDKVNPDLKNILTSLQSHPIEDQGGNNSLSKSGKSKSGSGPASMKSKKRFSKGDTQFDGVAGKALQYFAEAPQDRTNLMFILSGGTVDILADGNIQPDMASDTSNPLSLLDGLNVHRFVVSVGTGSGTSQGDDLLSIDSRPGSNQDASAGNELAARTDVLTNTFLSNSAVGTILDFKLLVNGAHEPAFDASVVKLGSVGFSYGTLVVPVPYFHYGTSNMVKVAILIDHDGDPNTTNDQLALEVENIVKGGLPSDGKKDSPNRRLRASY